MEAVALRRRVRAQRGGSFPTLQRFQKKANRVSASSFLSPLFAVS
jgi:hypothetical protein